MARPTEVLFASTTEDARSNEETIPKDREVVGAVVERKRGSGIRIGRHEVTREVLKQEQQEDPNLQKCLEKVDEVRRTKGGTASCFYMNWGLLWRRYHQSTGKDFNQLVVPEKLKGSVLEVAHDIPMTGHVGIRKMTVRVLSTFYWPGI